MNFATHVRLYNPSVYSVHMSNTVFIGILNEDAARLRLVGPYGTRAVMTLKSA